MRQSKRLLTLLFAALLVLQSAEARKKAFTVFIGDYPATSGWSKIHAANDKSIVLATLQKNGFLVSDIICLEESHATYQAISESLQSFVKSCQSGDQIYIHFSCHGQWITDINGDERLRNPRDQYDESIIPYDAQVAFNWGGLGYKGENHLIDDDIERYLLDIENKIGRKGYLLIVIDACHSGDAHRLSSDEDNEEGLFLCRGSKNAFDLPYKGGGTPRSHTTNTDCIIITACYDFESNYECTIDGVQYGRLSYAISKVWKPGMDQESLRDAIEEEYRSLSIISPLPKERTQRPTFVPSKKYSDRKLF